jgi:nucleoside-diphosphate-sugar epimerase
MILPGLNAKLSVGWFPARVRVSAASLAVMRVVVIGGTGHIGSYLVPQLVLQGHEVVVLSRGRRDPYQPHGAWQRVRIVNVDRQAEEKAGTFGSTVAVLEPDVVVDLICFTEESARHLAEALRGRVQHLLHCGTIWVHGASLMVPTTEESPRHPIGEYGIAKASIERYLLDSAARDGLPVTVIHPGHISGPEWTPINPAGNLDLGVFQALADGRELTLPDRGLATLQHVYAGDVAGVFLAAIANRSTAVGESFHAVSAGALTLRGYAEAVAAWFGQEAYLAYLPWEQWRQNVSAEAARVTRDHLIHSPHCSMDKAGRLLGFRPRYSALDTVLEAVDGLVRRGEVVRTS